MVGSLVISIETAEIFLANFLTELNRDGVVAPYANRFYAPRRFQIMARVQF